MPQWGSNMTQTALFIRSHCRHPSLSARFMACKVLDDSQSTLSCKGRVSGQDNGNFRERGWRTLANFFFPLCMWPWCISPCLHTRICPHACKESCLCVSGFKGSCTIGTFPGGLQRPPFGPKWKYEKYTLGVRDLKDVFWVGKFSCVTAIFFTFFGSSEKRGKKWKKNVYDRGLRSTSTYCTNFDSEGTVWAEKFEAIQWCTQVRKQCAGCNVMPWGPY